MKKLLLNFLSVAIVAFVISCSEPSQDEIVREKAEAHLFPKLNDPDSYEFVSLELYDEILYSHNIQYRREYFKNRLESTQRDITRTEEAIGTPSEWTHTKNDLLKYHAELNNIQIFLTGIDSLEQVLGEDANKVAAYSYLYTFRANNALGAKVLNEYIVQVNPGPGYEIIHMSDDPDEIILNPNDFPGYREMAANIQKLSKTQSQ